MPVELEGYIRPGCIILTVFVAMPRFMWMKLLEDPKSYVHNFVATPGGMLSGRGNILVYLNNMMFYVVKDGTSVIKAKVDVQAPKLHYVHPTCFEAGKPMEFVACGSNLLLPKLRYGFLHIPDDLIVFLLLVKNKLLASIAFAYRWITGSSYFDCCVAVSL
jgi:hypothetical protein